VHQLVKINIYIKMHGATIKISCNNPGTDNTPVCLSRTLEPATTKRSRVSNTSCDTFQSQ